VAAGRSWSLSIKLEGSVNLTINIKRPRMVTTKNINIPHIDNYDTLFLKIEILFSPLSYFFKPYITIGNIKHFFEYGSSGVRYLNLSHIKNNTQIKTNIKLNSKLSKLYGFKNNIDLNKENILILSPHADDAEISSFGFYKSAKNVTIVTVTAGESGICNYCNLYQNNKEKSAIKKAKLRTFDAITTPLLGGVEACNTLLLGYFTSTLKQMAQDPTKEFYSKIKNIKKTDDFRKVSHAKIKLDAKVKPTYDFLLKDMYEIINQLKPTLIITPHPQIDSHLDHQQTTFAIMQALTEQNHHSKILLYTNHLNTSELYPIGDMHSAITLPPNKDRFDFDSIYSFYLDDELQTDKFFALESMHDLKDSTIYISLKSSFKHFKKMLMRKITGKDKSYFRRALRSNELFFIVNKPL
jgi:LmbE family N-acetylglucosaminyl deacetylase